MINNKRIYSPSSLIHQSKYAVPYSNQTSFPHSISLDKNMNSIQLDSTLSSISSKIPSKKPTLNFNSNESSNPLSFSQSHSKRQIFFSCSNSFPDKLNNPPSDIFSDFFIPDPKSHHFVDYLQQSIVFCSFEYPRNSHEYNQKIELLKLIKQSFFNVYNISLFPEEVIHQLFTLLFSYIFRNISGTPIIPFDSNENRKIQKSYASDSGIFPEWDYLIHIYQILNTLMKIAPDSEYFDYNFFISIVTRFNCQEYVERLELSKIAICYLKNHPGDLYEALKYLLSLLSNFIEFGGSASHISPTLDVLLYITKKIPKKVVPHYLTCILPLVRSPSLIFYSQSFGKIFEYILDLVSDQKLYAISFSSLLKWWPISNDHKQIFFLVEIVNIINNCAFPTSYLKRYGKSLIIKILYAMSSSLNQLAETGFIVFTNYKIQQYIHNSNSLYPIMIPIILREISRDNSGNNNSKPFVKKAIQVLKTLDRNLFNKEAEKFYSYEKENQDQKSLEWLKIIRNAVSNGYSEFLRFNISNYPDKISQKMTLY